MRRVLWTPHVRTTKLNKALVVRHSKEGVSILDISNRIDGIFIYVNSSIPSCRPSCKNLCRETQAVPFEINLRKENMLVKLIYCLSSQNSEFFLNNLTMMVNCFAPSFDNFLTMGDFNMEPSDPFVTSFFDGNSLINLIKKKTCLKGRHWFLY